MLAGCHQGLLLPLQRLTLGAHRQRLQVRGSACLQVAGVAVTLLNCRKS